MTTKRVSVTVARLPEEAITELDERIGELWREENIDHDNDELISDDMMNTFNLLTIGYDAAWTEVERLSAALEEAEKEKDKAIDLLGDNLDDKAALIWKPKVVIWENVKGVLDRSVVPIFNGYLQTMAKLGYTNSFEVLNAMDFGIPQARERVFCISIFGNVAFDFTRLEKQPLRHINEFLEDKITDERYMINIPSMISRLKDLATPEQIDAAKKKHRFIETIDSYCATITERQDRCPNAGVVKVGEAQYRYLTELECWRLMGFDDEDFYLMLKEFPMKPGLRNATLYALAGNSIVVQVLEAIFKVIINEDYGTDLIADSTGQLQLIY